MLVGCGHEGAVRYRPDPYPYLSTTSIYNNSTNPSYDLRYASKVKLIPEGEIDRSSLVGIAAPWFAKDAKVKNINERLPWYAVPTS